MQVTFITTVMTTVDIGDESVGGVASVIEADVELAVENTFKACPSPVDGVHVLGVIATKTANIQTNYKY